jgi:hypothetical protein
MSPGRTPAASSSPAQAISRRSDLWFWALEALVTYVRAAGEHGGETVPAVCEVHSITGGEIATRTDTDPATIWPRTHHRPAAGSS